MKLSRRRLLGAGCAGTAVLGVLGSGTFGNAAANGDFEITRTRAEWRSLLTDEQYSVLRRENTERPFSSPLYHERRRGTFACAGCGLAVFASATKFESGTGWPSFWRPLDDAVASRDDTLFGIPRTEVHCRRCGGHFGHVFNDGPRPTGLRYCINGAALTFTPAA